MCDNECISKGKCEHNEECYDDVCFTSEQSKVVEKLIAKAKETERAKVLDEVCDEVALEERWLFTAIHEDKGNYNYNIDMAFSSLKSSLQKLKEQKK